MIAVEVGVSHTIFKVCETARKDWSSTGVMSKVELQRKLEDSQLDRYLVEHHQDKRKPLVDSFEAHLYIWSKPRPVWTFRFGNALLAKRGFITISESIFLVLTKPASSKSWANHSPSILIGQKVGQCSLPRRTPAGGSPDKTSHQDH